MFVSCECRVLSGVGLCVGLITRPEDPTECGVSEYHHGLVLHVTFSYFSTEVPGRRLAQSV